MSSQPRFTITYWGVTGTLCDPLLPAQVTDKLVEAIRLLAEKGRLEHLRPGPSLEEAIRKTLAQELPFHLYSSYGGNTTCIEVQTPDSLIIFDCGSGFRELGIALDARWKSEGSAAHRKAHVLLTHAHMDHTFATPFFAPYFNSANSFIIWGPKVALDSLAAVLDPKSSLSQIYFPPTYDHMSALHDFRPLMPGAEFSIGSTHITTAALNHPGGSMAYRLENAGRVFVFATDHEQTEVPDRSLTTFAQDADLLYTEGQYTQAEYEGQAGIDDDAPMSRRGWGHSSIEACVRTALAGGVRRLHVGHRDPRRSDRQIFDLNAYLQNVLHEELRQYKLPDNACEALVPYEGMTIHL